MSRPAGGETVGSRERKRSLCIMTPIPYIPSPLDLGMSDSLS